MARTLRKAGIVSLVTAFTFALGIAPAFASPFSWSDHEAPLAAAATQQMLNTNAATDQGSESFDLMLSVIADDRGPKHGFDVEAAIALAEQEIGTSRATGWSQPGECIISAKRWVLAGGGNWTTSGTPVSNYENATRLPISMASPGDIIQYENLHAPNAWVTGVHTLMVTGINDDGSLQIIESNYIPGSGLVSKNDNWLPAPSPGFQAVVWRF